ncbi:efflux RND transporter permease subunit [Virgibacillus sp. 179-BFC.A HS]|uniref:Efflux RND transporter permease subunit n=1 Tax=Tigheibacillus jepli TaxID=3035914 RepID=A0ABU5CE47_9BACI|nr:efflux RND transporter permease subunit [Virgibacillus sp. 179-BFC.A HS]MDY0404589.1 efflux RND transporter permease subunit [Virgibacillus sp. 179-BFC.A HS]
MKLVNLSVKRPVGLIMIVLAIVALGVVSVRNLVIDLFPKIDLPVAVVATTYQDAAPQEVENMVSRPVESAVSTVEGIETVQSQSQLGSSLVLMEFANGVDLDQALLDVREKIDQVKGMLPDSAGDPRIMRFSPEQMPVMWISITGKDAASLTQLADDQLVPFFERQQGVASVSVEGAKQREIAVLLDSTKMKQYQMSAQTITQALNSHNKTASVGTVEKGTQDLQLRVVGEYDSLQDIANTQLQTPAGAVIHLDDVAKIKDTYKESGSVTLVNGKPAVVLSLMKKTDANTVAVADQIRSGVDKIAKNIPDDVHLKVVIDTSDFIKLSIQSVVQNILLGGIISIFVLLLFLKSFRATLVIALSIPIAIISTFALMYFTGETLNVLTLGGLALGIGMMVDSSIVILENIYAYRQRGYSLFESATKGAAELAPAVIASTTTTLVVFLPIVYVKGIASDLFTPLALTVSFSLIASLVVAVTLVPMLSSKLLAAAMEDHGRRYWFARLMDRVNNGYARGLKGVLKYRKTTIFVTVLAIAGSLALIPFIGAEFIPASDQGQLQVKVETARGSSLKHTESVVSHVTDKMNKYRKEIETDYVSIGGGDFGFGGSGTNQATYTIQLVPASERAKSTTAIMQDLDKELQTIPGAEISVSEMGANINMGDPIQIQLNGPEHEVLNQLAKRVMDEVASVKGVHNVESSATEGVPQMDIAIDKEKAAMYGLSQEQVLSQIQTQFTGQVAGKYREAGHEMDITLMYPKDQHQTIGDLEDMQIQTQSGTSIPLEEVAVFKEKEGPSALFRQNQQPQLNITSGIVGRDLAGVVSDVEDKLNRLNFPEGYSYTMGGQAEDMVDSFSDLAKALVFSIFLVYAVMAVQFENFLFPFIIMFSMPATVVGVLLGLFVTGLALSIPAFIGIIMLAGIVVNNAIVLVDYINILRRRGIDRYEAIVEAGRSRLRPILMTTLTTILGMVPLALALGEGAETQQPLAVTIIFGLGISSIFTLFLVPVVYTYFDDLTAKIVRKRK